MSFYSPVFRPPNPDEGPLERDFEPLRIPRQYLTVSLSLAVPVRSHRYVSSSP